jgi:hypothetical protein
MEINYVFNLWGNLFSIIGVGISSFVAFWIYKLSRQLSVAEKYKHEIEITGKINELGIYKSVILADVRKYHPLRTDTSNKTYYKQGAELYRTIQEYGVQVILHPSDENIPVGLVPFEWIEYIRDSDSEDTKPIVVCKFKGVKWHKDFKSPFREIDYLYENKDYNEYSDPPSMRFTHIKPNQETI